MVDKISSNNNMEVGRRRTTRNGVVAAGSVWESRMKTEEFKVFNGDESSEENSEKKLRPKQSPPPPVAGTGKRKTWKSANSEVSPIQIAGQRSEPSTGSNDCKELSVSEGIKRSPVQKMKTRSEMVGKEMSTSFDGIERSPVQKTKSRAEENKDLNVFVERPERIPIQIRKGKSESQKLICQTPGESGDGETIDKNSVQLRKVKSEPKKAVGESADGNARNPIPVTKAKLGTAKSLEVLSDETKRVSNGLNKDTDESLQTIEKNPVEIEKPRSEEPCNEFVVCEEKTISSSLNSSSQVKSAPDLIVPEGDVSGDSGDEEEYWDDEESDEEVDEEIEIEVKAKRFDDVKEINLADEQKTKQVMRVVKKLHQVQEKPLPISPIVKKQAPPLVNHSRTHPLPIKTKAVPASDGFQRAPQTHAGFKTTPHPHNKLQSFVDLVMWRDVSKSAFVFGVGSFLIISLSYTQDLNFSFISVVSYLGLVYLAAIFLFRSIINRGAIDTDYTSQCYVVGEEESVWLLELVLPYLNEFLVKLRALFSGDPATTMKLAVLLFVLAKCGSSITIWKMAKLGFFGAFIVPKLCSSYSTQLTAFGKFWIRRFQDAWESCSHKKAVAFGIFTLVWNLSSVVARIWAVFMLYVAFRYYQQSIVRDDWVEEEPKCETSWQAQAGGRARARGTTKVEIKNKAEIKKEKKRF